tara:strand:- start:2803 stop:3084 length:282 start_codon:yes stop_codon:yes gene_type:complete
MGQYDDVVEKQRAKLAAEKWKDEFMSMHIHQLKSMWYDDRPQDTDNGSVTDIQYRDRRIERYKDGVLIHTFTGEQVSGDALIDQFLKENQKFA